MRSFLTCADTALPFQLPAMKVSLVETRTVVLRCGSGSERRAGAWLAGSHRDAATRLRGPVSRSVSCLAKTGSSADVIRKRQVGAALAPGEVLAERMQHRNRLAARLVAEHENTSPSSKLRRSGSGIRR